MRVLLVDEVHLLMRYNYLERWRLKRERVQNKVLWFKDKRVSKLSLCCISSDQPHNGEPILVIGDGLCN